MVRGVGVGLSGAGEGRGGRGGRGGRRDGRGAWTCTSTPLSRAAAVQRSGSAGWLEAIGWSCEGGGWWVGRWGGGDGKSRGVGRGRRDGDGVGVRLLASGTLRVFGAPACAARGAGGGRVWVVMLLEVARVWRYGCGGGSVQHQRQDAPPNIPSCSFLAKTPPPHLNLFLYTACEKGQEEGRQEEGRQAEAAVVQGWGEGRGVEQQSQCSCWSALSPTLVPLPHLSPLFVNQPPSPKLRTSISGGASAAGTQACGERGHLAGARPAGVSEREGLWLGRCRCREQEGQEEGRRQEEGQEEEVACAGESGWDWALYIRMWMVLGMNSFCYC